MHDTVSATVLQNTMTKRKKEKEKRLQYREAERRNENWGHWSGEVDTGEMIGAQTLTETQS